MPGRPHQGGELFATLPSLALGVRLLAFAIVAGSGAFLPLAGASRAPLAAGILAGALIAYVQHRLSRSARPIPGPVFVLAFIANWTWLVVVTGGRHSPFLVGYLIEIPLSALLLSRLGCVLASIAGAAAAVGVLVPARAPEDRLYALIALGFIALTTVLTWNIVGLIERQQRQIRDSRAALSARAENLAEELRLLGDYLGGALVGIDDLGRIASINQAGLTLLGLERGRVMGRAWQEVMRPDAAARARIAATLAGGASERGLRMAVERADGRQVTLAADLWAAPSVEGRRTWLLLDEPGPAEGSEDPLRRLGEAVACVSHQIKNSFHVLQGLANGLERAPALEEGARASARQLLRALENLGALAEDVLAMAGAPRSGNERVPLHDVVTSAVVLARQPAERVRIEPPAQEIFVRAHRGRLVHALFNLIDNACRVTPAEASVTVSFAECEGRACVEIADRGPGCPPGLERGRGRAASAAGSGFGVLAARRFLDDCGAELAYERDHSGGTRCRVSLERADECVAEV